MLKNMLTSGKNFANPPTPIAFAQSVDITEATKRMNTAKAAPIVMRLFLKKGRSFFTFQITFNVDSTARKILAEPHKNATTPMIAMTIEVCFIVEIFLTISSMPTGKICLIKGISLSITPSDEPRTNKENEIIPKMSGKRLNTIA